MSFNEFGYTVATYMEKDLLGLTLVFFIVFNSTAEVFLFTYIIIMALFTCFKVTVYSLN